MKSIVASGCLLLFACACTSSKSKLRIDAPAAHRAAFVDLLNRAADCTGKPLVKQTYTLRTHKGVSKKYGFWQAPLPPNNTMAWALTWNGGRNVEVAADPKTGAIDYPTLQHECVHAVLMPHGILGHPSEFKKCAIEWHLLCLDGVTMEPTGK